MEISKSQLDMWVRISHLSHRPRKAPQLNAGGAGLAVAKGVLQGPSTAWAVVAYTAWEDLDTLLFF